MDVVLVTKNGMIKRTAVDEFRQQGRGGGGITAMSLANGDKVVGAVGLSAQSVMVVTAGGRACALSGLTRATPWSPWWPSSSHHSYWQTNPQGAVAPLEGVHGASRARRGSRSAPDPMRS